MLTDLRNLRWHDKNWPLIVSGVVAIAHIVGAHPASAFDSNPTPYDPVEYSQMDLARSSSQYFILDALLPYEYQRALDDRKFFSITTFSLGAFTNSSTHNQSMISVNDLPIMEQPKSVYSEAISASFDVRRFYEPRYPQTSVSGILALDGSTILQWGFNTGYDSWKLTVSPSIMIGLAKRFYLSDTRDSHIILEASNWIGGSVKHRPCYSNYDRQYFCGDAIAWTDYSYDARPQSAFMKVTYEKVF